MTFSMFALALLSACAAQSPDTGGYGSGRYDMSAAEAACVKKGYRPGNYEYDSCFQNQPQVQAWERDGRMNGLNILKANRSSAGTRGGRSYPVE
ncbi:MAG: hypothetical protein H6865_01345 [Rhodospirillales bacterium]|nr:hypothetical protein [Rhodospirillales bacterium]